MTTAIREFTQPHTYDFRAYGTELGTVIEAPGGGLIIDPDAEEPGVPFTVANPDFNFKSLRVNGILRWEWRAGSTIYVVWTENRRDATRPGDYSFSRDMADVFTAPPDDVLMLKVSWWIGR